MANWRRTTTCRSCGTEGLTVVLDLGEQPLANALLQHPDQAEDQFPLELAICDNCTLAQLTVSVDPSLLFEDYVYFTSFSKTMVRHAATLAAEIISSRALGRGSRVVEIASNDGYLLQHYLAAGVEVVGVDPARAVAEAANARGIDTRCAFFDGALAGSLAAEGRADVIHAHNVLAHVPDLDGILEGVGGLLAPDGVVIIETPWLVPVVSDVAFDAIYHEHLFTFSLTALAAALERNGLRVVDVAVLPIHNGSLRVTAMDAATAPAPTSAVERVVRDERRSGVLSAAGLAGFAVRAREAMQAIGQDVRSRVAAGQRLAAYGATAKGTVLLNACGVGPESLPWVADVSPHKQGRYLPGVHLPIVTPARLLEDQPDAVMLLARNITDEVLESESTYIQRGGRFIVPLPKPKEIP